MWMGRAESEVMKDEKFDNFGHVHIQCWVSMRKKQGTIENCIKIVR